MKNLKIMKRAISIFTIIFFVGSITLFTSCQDLLDTESNRVMLSDDNVLNSPNDTVYSIIGILTKVQKLSDKYVLLGELRADLMNVTSYSKSELRDLNNFEVDSATSSFCNVKDFYAVINNCNYFIQKVDTNIVTLGTKPFVKEIAIVKSIRAWTYLQLVLNYGKATYFEKPLITINDGKESFPVYDLQQIVDALILDLTPYADVEYPKYGSINGVECIRLFVNTKFLLGDLYLWKASMNGGNLSDYEQAATYYGSLIKSGQYIVQSSDAIKWSSIYFTSYNNSWSNILYSSTGSNELITTIKLSSSVINGVSSSLADLSSNYELTTSKQFEDLFAKQMYSFPNTAKNPVIPAYFVGDLRLSGTINSTIDGYSINGRLLETGSSIISKYSHYNVNVFRIGLLYLRYAEALNRLGKPSLAFAVLKYGLSPATLTDVKKITARELTPVKTYISVFNNSSFVNNVGVHNRGCGSSEINKLYVIPLTVTNKTDSILFVEDAISDELALETGLEGNRFHDLMRISNYRNSPAYLAQKVAAKHTDYNRIYNLLLDNKNWFLPIKK
jgi:hypothetical protein